MCGPYEHSHWKQVKNGYKVLIDRELNSHHDHSEKHQLGPEWHKSGVDIVNGEPCTNDNTPLPDEVYTRLKILFQAAFPDRSCIIQFIKSHYNRYEDKDEWNDALLQMVSSEGLQQLSQGCLEGISLRCMMLSQSCHIHSRLLRERSQKYHQLSLKFYNRLLKKANNSMVRSLLFRRIAQNCSGKYTHFDLDVFCELFESYPNSYWEDKNSPTDNDYDLVVREEIVSTA